MNPWIWISLQPKSAIRTLAAQRPRSEFWILSAIYGLAAIFHSANFYSWGLSRSFLSIFIPLLFLSPLFGALTLFIDAWILSFTAPLFGPSKASFSHLKTAVAWSRTPSLLLLAMWTLLSFSNPATVFIHYSTNGSAAMITLVYLTINLWSFGLLVQSLRELQTFTLIQSLANATLTYAISFLFYLVALFIGRYIYISIF